VTTPTPDPPAATEPVAYLDRVGDVWAARYKPDGLYLRDPWSGESWWKPFAAVEADWGPLVPLVRADVAAARVAAAEQRGAEKALRDVIERLRGFGVDPAVVEHFTVLLAVQQSHAATARAASVDQTAADG
jgi:hypothetical protein